MNTPTLTRRAFSEFMEDMSIRTMNHVAERIARLSETDPVAARNDYEQHLSTMTDSERAEFLNMLVAAKAGQS